MNYQEKLAFVKAHLGEEVQFSDVATWARPSRLRLGGIRDSGRFISSSGRVWDFCRLIPKAKFIDWTIETAESVQLRHKSSGAKVWVNYGNVGTWYRSADGNTEILYSKLREEWETVDGRPCGTEVKDD